MSYIKTARYRKIFPTVLCSVILALIFSGCSDTIGQSGEISDSDEITTSEDLVYITFSVMVTDNYSLKSRGEGEEDEEEESENGNRFDSDNPDTEDQFNKGLSLEQAICKDPGAHHMVLFFNEGKLLALKPLIEMPDYLKEEDVESPEVAKVWQSYACAKCDEPLAMVGNMKSLTAYIVLNPGAELLSKIFTLSLGATYDDVMELFQAQLSADYNGTSDYLFYKGEDGEKYFTMTSSMVVSESDSNVYPSVLAKNEKRETELLPGATVQFWSTLEEALRNPISMYAERMQAKYTLSFTPDLSPAHTHYVTKENKLIFGKREFPEMTSRVHICTEYNVPSQRSNSIDAKVELKDWKVNIVGWGVNATEKSEYLFKNIKGNSNYYEGWNNYSDTRIRNFWSESRNYDKGTYPDQYREAWDDPKVTPTQGEANTLNYFSFNQFKQRDAHQYSAENTWDISVLSTPVKDAIEAREHLRCGTHLIVAAQLLIDGMDTSFEDPTVDKDGMIREGIEDKYYMNDIYWTKEAYINYAYEHLGYMLESTVPRYKYVNSPEKEVLNQNTRDGEGLSPNDVFKPKPVDGNIGTRFYVKQGGSFVAATGKNFEIKPLYIKGGDGWVYVCPQLDESHPGMTVLYVLQEEGASDYQVSDGENFYSQISLEEYNGLAYTYTPYMGRHFNNGCMYYPLPVFHNGDASKIAMDAPGKQPSLETGDIGVVRNHWYHIDINGIASPGCPVDNLDQPIIPNNEPETPGLRLNVNIIPWHYVIQDVYF